MNSRQFRAARNKLGWSKQQCADKLKCTRRHIDRMEMDETSDSFRKVNPQIAELMRLYVEVIK